MGSTLNCFHLKTVQFSLSRLLLAGIEEIKEDTVCENALKTAEPFTDVIVKLFTSLLSMMIMII